MAKYKSIWQNLLPSVFFTASKALFYGTEQNLQLDQNSFESIGYRHNSGYSFKLEVENGTVKNDINGTQVARDLYDVLVSDEFCRHWISTKLITLRLGKNFILNINVSNLS